MNGSDDSQAPDYSMDSQVRTCGLAKPLATFTMRQLQMLKDLEARHQQLVGCTEESTPSKQSPRTKEKRQESRMPTAKEAEDTGDTAPRKRQKVEEQRCVLLGGWQRRC